MTLKQFKMVAVINIFILSFLFHFMNSWFTNKFFSIIFPVNESIWEHMKLIASGILIYGILEFFLLKICNIHFNNYIASLFLAITLGIVFFLIIYLPLFSLFGENFFLNIFVLFIVICICEVISYFVLKSKKYKFINWVSLIGILLLYVLFGILTYFPLNNGLFYDKTLKEYGLNNNR